MANIEELKEYFKKDVFVKNCGIIIENVSESVAVCSVETNDGHKNAEGIVQGGLIYTLADFTFAVLANNLHPVSLTQSATVTYLAATRSSKLIATAREIAVKGRNCVVEVLVTDIDDNIVSIVNINGFIKATK